MEDWQIVFAIVVPILAVVIPLLVHFNNVNRGAHTKIGENIDKVEENLRADARESEKRLNDNINKVHGDVRLLLDHALRKKSDGSAKDARDQDFHAASVSGAPAPPPEDGRASSRS